MCGKFKLGFSGGTTNGNYFPLRCKKNPDSTEFPLHQLVVRSKEESKEKNFKQVKQANQAPSQTALAMPSSIVETSALLAAGGLFGAALTGLIVSSWRQRTKDTPGQKTQT